MKKCEDCRKVLEVIESLSSSVCVGCGKRRRENERKQEAEQFFEENKHKIYENAFYKAPSPEDIIKKSREERDLTRRS